MANIVPIRPIRVIENVNWIVNYLRRYNGVFDRVWVVIEHGFVRETGRDPMEFETALRYALKKGIVHYTGQRRLST